MQNAELAAEAALASPTLNALLDAYQRDRENPFSYRRCKTPAGIKSHLKPIRAAWGEWEIATFCKGSKARVREQVQQWRDGGVGFSTCRKRLAHFRAAIRFCISDEIITRDLEPVFEMPPSGAPRERFIDHEKELPALLKAIEDLATPHHIRLACILSLVTGQRKSAVLALRWDEHIDFEKRIIRFRDTEAAEDRSKKRRTDMPMDDYLFGVLQRAHDRREGSAVVEWRGKPIKNCFHGMRKALNRAGLPDVRQHDLRRTSATYVNRGLGLEGAARHIGDTVEMARKHYVWEEAQERLPGIEAVSGILAQAKAP